MRSVTTHIRGIRVTDSVYRHMLTNSRIALILRTVDSVISARVPIVPVLTLTGLTAVVGADVAVIADKRCTGHTLSVLALFFAVTTVGIGTLRIARANCERYIFYGRRAYFGRRRSNSNL